MPIRKSHQRFSILCARLIMKASRFYLSRTVPRAVREGSRFAVSCQWRKLDTKQKNKGQSEEKRLFSVQITTVTAFGFSKKNVLVLDTTMLIIVGWFRSNKTVDGLGIRETRSHRASSSHLIDRPRTLGQSSKDPFNAVPHVCHACLGFFGIHLFLICLVQHWRVPSFQSRHLPLACISNGNVQSIRIFLNSWSSLAFVV